MIVMYSPQTGKAQRGEISSRGRNVTLDVDRHHWFKSVILPEEPALLSRLRRILSSPDEAEDVTAETLARAYVATDFARITAGRAYLFQISRNLLIDAARRNKIVSFDLMADLDQLQVDDGLEACLHARDELRHLQAIIETLPIQCRRVFILRRVYEHSIGEIADQMGLSVSTVEKHLTKAVMRVMNAIRDREELGGQWIETTRLAALADRGRSGRSRC